MCNYKVIMDIDNGDKSIVLMDNIDCILANKYKLFRENSESRDNIEYKIVLQ